MGCTVWGKIFSDLAIGWTDRRFPMMCRNLGEPNILGGKQFLIFLSADVIVAFGLGFSLPDEVFSAWDNLLAFTVQSGDHNWYDTELQTLRNQPCLLSRGRFYWVFRFSYSEEV